MFNDQDERLFFWGCIVPAGILLWTIVLSGLFMLGAAIYKELGI